jgi:transglutaminase-like putative cysteine protease
MIRIGDLINAVTYLCACLGYMAVAPHIGWASTAGFCLLFGAGAYRDFRRAFAAPRWLLNAVSMGVLSAAFSRVRLDYLVEPVLDALIILVGIKLLEDKRNRDYLQVLGLCAFLLVGASLLSIHISFLVYYSLLAFLATLALILLTIHSHSPTLVLDRRYAMSCLLQAAVICAVAIPASGAFFLILPRTNYPLFTFLSKASGARTGFSDSVSLGQVAAIQEDDSVIFRAEMTQIDDNELYWRGIVLDVFEGKSWKSSRPESVDTAQAKGGETIEQVIYLEPYGNRVLFALDRPVAIWRQERGHEREVTQFRDPVLERVRYKAVSSVQSPLPESSSEREDPRYLQLPEDFSPQIREIVSTIAPFPGRMQRVTALFNHLRARDFSYSLEELPVSSTPLEDFLLVHKRGNCEYFASALGVMLRISGVPARRVGGYRGGVYNRSGRYYLVQQKNAHVWVEALLAGYGWMRLDPTPLGSEFGPLTPVAGVLGRLRVLIDTFNHYWIKFVINYDLERQFRIVRGLRDHWREADWRLKPERVPLRGIAIAGGGVMLLAGVILLFRRRRTEPERELRELVREFLRRMKRRGYVKGKAQGLEEFAAGIEDDELRERAYRFVEEFQVIYYRDQVLSVDAERRLRAIIRDL